MSTPVAPAASTATPAARRGMPPHRLALLLLTACALSFAAIQTGWRLWLSSAGEPVVGIVDVATDSCRSRHRANCYLGRAIVNPKMDRHRFKTTKISGGRFYTVGEEVPMRVHPNERMYFAAVYTPMNWLLGPIRSGAVALLWLFAALMPAHRKALWIVPCVLSLFLIFG